jgi:DDE superfamily endonuclease
VHFNWKARKPACIDGRQWPTPYYAQNIAWMDVTTCWKWFNKVFYPSVKARTGRPVLLLLDNVPGHFAAFERQGVTVVFFPPGCTAWRQPCGMEIIATLKKLYMSIYLKNILSFFDLDDETKELKRQEGANLGRGSTGVDFGNPAHILGA